MKTAPNYQFFGIATTEYVTSTRYSGTTAQLVDACLATKAELTLARRVGDVSLDKDGRVPMVGDVPVDRQSIDGGRRIERRPGNRFWVTVLLDRQELSELGSTLHAERRARQEEDFQTFLSRIT